LYQYATAGALAVNYPVLTNSLTTAAVTYGAAGSDAAVDIKILPKGAGVVNIPAFVTGVTRLDVDNIRVDGNSITSTSAAGAINLTPDTTGDLVLDGLKWPQADGSASTLLTTDGAGQLSWTSGTFPSVGASGTVIRSNGANWVASTATFADTYAVNTILYASSSNTVSGLGAAARGVLVSDNTSVPSMLASASVTGQVLQGSTTGAPAWSTPTYPSASGTAGKILRSDGTNNEYTTATFANTYAVSTILYASASNAVSGLATANSAALVTTSAGVPVMSGSMSNGQLIIGSSGATPAAANITAGTGISVTNGAGSITIDCTVGGLTTTTIAGTTQAAAVDNGYIVGNASQTTITLPATFAIGALVKIKGFGAGGWILAASAGDTIVIGQSVTSSGGSLTSAGNYDSIQVSGLVANTTWSVDYVYSAGVMIA